MIIKITRIIKKEIEEGEEENVRIFNKFYN